MEFDEMKKLWDSQNNEPLYVINEKALHNRILSKKRKAHHITNVSELLLITVNSCAGGFILAMNLYTRNAGIVMYLLAFWMFGSALYSLVSRVRRLKGLHQFDRSMHGDLDHAVSMATYQVHLSQIMRWNTLPIAILVILGVWEGEKSVWVTGLILIFFALTFYASAWEHNIYKVRKRELEILQNKLENDTPGSDHPSRQSSPSR